MGYRGGIRGVIARNPRVFIGGGIAQPPASPNPRDVPLGRWRADNEGMGSDPAVIAFSGHGAVKVTVLTGIWAP